MLRLCVSGEINLHDITFLDVANSTADGIDSLIRIHAAVHLAGIKYKTTLLGRLHADISLCRSDDARKQRANFLDCKCHS